MEMKVVKAQMGHGFAWQIIGWGNLSKSHSFNLLETALKLKLVTLFLKWSGLMIYELSFYFLSVT